jgi:hypothetical protein
VTGTHKHGLIHYQGKTVTVARIDGDNESIVEKKFIYF